MARAPMKKSAKLSKVKARNIRRRHRDGESIRSLSKKYGVTRQAIQKCVNGRTYKKGSMLPL